MIRNTEVEGYLIEQHLGSGTFGEVYKVRHKETNQYFAMKVIKVRNLNKRQQTFLDREINILQRFQCEGILRCFKTFLSKNPLGYYIILELHQNGDLDKMMYSVHSFPEDVCKNIFYELLLALSKLHRQNIVHRDLKPANILISDEKKPIISDFGLSRESEGMMESLVGSKLYMAPQTLNREEYTKKCDVWTLGIILYQFLFYCNDLQGLLQQIKNPAQIKVPNFPQTSFECKDFLKKCLAIDENQRLSIEELLEHSWMQKDINYEIAANFIHENLEPKANVLNIFTNMLKEIFTKHLFNLFKKFDASNVYLDQLIDDTKNLFPEVPNLLNLLILFLWKKVNELNAMQCDLNEKKEFINIERQILLCVNIIAIELFKSEKVDKMKLQLLSKLCNICLTKAEGSKLTIDCASDPQLSQINTRSILKHLFLSFESIEHVDQELLHYCTFTEEFFIATRNNDLKMSGEAILVALSCSQVL